MRYADAKKMADSERVDRRPEQLAECCYGLACIDALARRKRLLVTHPVLRGCCCLRPGSLLPGESHGATQPLDGPTHAASSIIVISPLQQLECEYIQDTSILPKLLEDISCLRFVCDTCLPPAPASTPRRLRGARLLVHR